MKLLISIALIFTGISSLKAKKVKFAVNTKGLTVNSTGMHITGDFQTLAGYPGGDWMSNTTPLTQEANDTNIYFVIVDIPAFAKYEYKFLNGDQFYDAEFVPVESRVGYDFNDNRWVYIDSTTNDTTLVGPLLFAGNAPEGKKLLRLLVDMQHVSSVSSFGVRVSGSFQGYNLNNGVLYSFGNALYENIFYGDSLTTYYYKYFNGNSGTDAETLPVACANNENRNLLLTKDTVLNAVCFASCEACGTNGIKPFTNYQAHSLFYPNPANEFIRINPEIQAASITVKDIEGRIVLEPESYPGKISTTHLNNGVYFLRITTVNGNVWHQKITIDKGNGY